MEVDAKVNAAVGQLVTSNYVKFTVENNHTLT